MQRRKLIACAAAPVLSTVSAFNPLAHAAPNRAGSRVRPGDPLWPAAGEWERLRHRLAGSLLRLEDPLRSCRVDPAGEACRDLFRELKNPYFIGDSPALTQTCEWVDAWTAQVSTYAVSALTAADVAVAVDFARRHHLRLVVKGGGHSYLGTSNAPDSLLIWTRAMNRIEHHDSFVPLGSGGKVAPVPAVSVGAGAIWMHTYDVVTSRVGRYVQGGGCGTVGVAGLVQGGGFGTHSKAFGTAGSS